MRREDIYLGSPIRSLQTMLRAISSDFEEKCCIIPDGIFGMQTKTGVKNVQKQGKMRATGVVDHTTWNRIVARFYEIEPKIMPSVPLMILWQPNQKIYPNEKNTHLYPIQSMLTVIGKNFLQMPSLSVNGVLDERTAACIRWLQKKCDLPQTGSIGAEEWAFLTKLYSLVAGDGTFSL